MIKNQIKSSIQRARAGIAFIIAAAVLSQLVNMAQYIYTRKSIQKQSVEKTYNNMLKLQRTAKLQTSVESAVQATMGDVRVNLNNPEMFYGITSRLVANNEYIVGSAIAMRPGYYPDKDKLFAPFAYPENKDGEGQPRVKLLPYDYTQQEWYATPVQKDSAMWTEPYFDKGGSEMLIRSYSLPIHDHENRVVGILTADVPYKDLASEDDFTYDEIDNSIDNVWSVLFTTGYLTRVGNDENGVFKLAIPNKEVRQVFVLQISEWFDRVVANDRAATEKINRGFLDGKVEDIQKELTMFLGETISILDTKARNEEKENFYHGILIGILKSYSDWAVKSNRESGDGFADILVKPKNPDVGIIMELKYAHSINELDKACKRALEQIRDRRYDEELREDGRNDILAYGIAFCKKRCKVVAERL